MLYNEVVNTLYKTNSEQLGLTYFELARPVGSTDMGNVSHIIPAIHPMYQIGDGTQMNHTREFTSVANIPEAYQNTLTAAKALAATAVDLYVTPKLIEQAKEEFSGKVAL